MVFEINNTIRIYKLANPSLEKLWCPKLIIQ